MSDDRIKLIAMESVLRRLRPLLRVYEDDIGNGGYCHFCYRGWGPHMPDCGGVALLGDVKALLGEDDDD